MKHLFQSFLESLIWACLLYKTVLNACFTTVWIFCRFIKWLWRHRPNCLRPQCCNNQVTDEKKTCVNSDTLSLSSKSARKFLRKERLKTPLNDFTLGEYTEKVIIYGFLMVLALSISRRFVYKYDKSHFTLLRW